MITFIMNCFPLFWRGFSLLNPFICFIVLNMPHKKVDIKTRKEKNPTKIFLISQQDLLLSCRISRDQAIYWTKIFFCYQSSLPSFSTKPNLFVMKAFRDFHYSVLGQLTKVVATDGWKWQSIKCDKFIAKSIYLPKKKERIIFLLSAFYLSCTAKFPIDIFNINARECDEIVKRLNQGFQQNITFSKMKA